MLKAKAIIIRNSPISEFGWEKLKTSSEKMNHGIDLSRFDAITPNEVDDTLLMFGVKWNYPWDEPVLDIASGMLKTPYKTVNKYARIAAALSHYTLWKMSCEYDEPLLILEHDALFIAPLDFDLSECPTCGIIGINDPRGATRKSMAYHKAIQSDWKFFQPPPWVDKNRQIPQGLAGNSAYIVKPEGARIMIRLVADYGLWPNDALMCRQLYSNLCVTRQYFTKTQGLKSTTTL